MAPQSTLYQQLGGEQGVASLVDNFIAEIAYDDTLFPYFAESDVDRFRSKFIEHMCEVADGPCHYTGDSMFDIHVNMGVTESVFNHTVDVLISAMNKTGIAHRVQNRLLARLAPMRKQIIYAER
ncbi:group I truncated hemoglobin [Pontibacter sp. JAM-7]|uniref:group I truncated hemoglobin n=1 Tax=Pontibacter sp. JAM-7 TaxID=3366581 RepID=UPI003AF62835